MRVNIYAEEISNDIEIIEKTTPDGDFTGLRMFMYLPVTLPNGDQAAGKFMHHPGDDDSAAITFWGKKDLREVLRNALHKLDQHYGKNKPFLTEEDAGVLAKSTVEGYMNNCNCKTMEDTRKASQKLVATAMELMEILHSDDLHVEET